MIDRKHHQKRWTKEENDVFFKHYRDKGSTYVGKLLGINDTEYIAMHARFLGLKIDPTKIGAICAERYRRSRATKRARKAREIAAIDWPRYITLNDETIYLLGYIWADGHVGERSPGYYRFAFSIVEADAENIAGVVSRFGCPISPHKRRYIPKQGCGRSPMISWSTGRWEVGHWFAMYDYHIKSHSQPTKILALIPAEKHYLFYRGYSDGDGSIHRDKHHFSWQVSSTVEQDWEFMKQAFRDQGILDYVDRKDVRAKGATGTFRTRYKADAYRWCQYLYHNREVDQIGLDRKYARYQIETSTTRSKPSPRVGMTH